MLKNLKLFSLAFLALILPLVLKAEGHNPTTKQFRVIAHKLSSTEVTSMSNTDEVILSLSLFVPNAFTPNGDGDNDRFGVSGRGIEEMTMQIYNRWGEMIFETDDLAEGWDGTFAGKALSNGVFVYKLYAKNADTDYLVKRGSVTLVK